MTGSYLTGQISPVPRALATPLPGLAFRFVMSQPLTRVPGDCQRPPHLSLGRVAF